MSISVERLRYELDQGSAFWEELQDKHTLSSLVDVLEAARVLVGKLDWTGANRHQELNDALARFDFSGAATSQSNPVQ